MPFTHGSKAVFKIGNASNTLTDISQYLTSVQYSPEVDTAEVTTLGATAKAYVAGLRDATISIEGIFEPAVDALLSGIIGLDARSFEYGPQGSTTGNVKYSGSCILTSYEVSTGLDGAGTFSAEFQVTGAVTRGTY